MGWQAGGGLLRTAERVRRDVTGSGDGCRDLNSVMDVVALKEDDSLG